MAKLNITTTTYSCTSYAIWNDGNMRRSVTTESDDSFVRKVYPREVVTPILDPEIY
ncbi:MAG TPA: hypothetical protein VEL70_08425 [Candidatus Acidoferrum sp.]|nr:hypothetical protein [Candidatus Acidoferrum sp.]